jgi:hypothetical protein
MPRSCTMCHPPPHPSHLQAGAAVAARSAPLQPRIQPPRGTQLTAAAAALDGGSRPGLWRRPAPQGHMGALPQLPTPRQAPQRDTHAADSTQVPHRQPPQHLLPAGFRQAGEVGAGRDNHLRLLAWNLLLWFNQPSCAAGGLSSRPFAFCCCCRGCCRCHSRAASRWWGALPPAAAAGGCIPAGGAAPAPGPAPAPAGCVGRGVGVRQWRCGWQAAAAPRQAHEAGDRWGHAQGGAEGWAALQPLQQPAAVAVTLPAGAAHV